MISFVNTYCIAQCKCNTTGSVSSADACIKNFFALKYATPLNYSYCGSYAKRQIGKYKNILSSPDCLRMRCSDICFVCIDNGGGYLRSEYCYVLSVYIRLSMMRIRYYTVSFPISEYFTNEIY